MGQHDAGRLGRLFGRHDEPDEDDGVAMSGTDEHAWWADRRSLSGPPGVTHQAEGAREVPDAPDDPQPSRWSAESLFADAGFDPSGTPPPPPTDDGTTTAVVATGLDEARLVLGVTSADTWESIGKAHRALAMQFHPDRLGDLSPDAQMLGQQRMAEINRAYETLREQRPKADNVAAT